MAETYRGGAAHPVRRGTGRYMQVKTFAAALLFPLPLIAGGGAGYTLLDNAEGGAPFLDVRWEAPLLPALLPAVWKSISSVRYG